MNKGPSSYYLLFLFLLGQVVCVGQKTSLRQELLNNFKPAGKEYWINEYIGKLDNIHDVSLGLLFDGEEYFGIYNLISSQTRFTLEGLKLEDEILLKEFDSLDRQTGTIKLSSVNGAFYGHWTDQSRTQEIPIRFYPVGHLPLPDAHLRSLYHHVYKNKAGNISQTVHHYNYNSRPRLTRYTETETSSFVSSDDGVFVCAVTGESLPEALRVLLVESKNYDKLSFTYESYIDYRSLWAVIKPRINSAFDKWLDQIFTDLCTNKPSKEVLGLEVLGPDDRFAQRFDGWVNISFYDEHFVSGVINFQSPDNGSIMKRGFVYDLDKKQELNWNSLLRKGITIDSVIVSQARQNSINSNKPFSTFCITPSGIQGETSFSTIYGEERVVVYAKTLDKYMKSKYLSKFWSNI